MEILASDEMMNEGAVLQGLCKCSLRGSAIIRYFARKSLILL